MKDKNRYFLVAASAIVMAFTQAAFAQNETKSFTVYPYVKYQNNSETDTPEKVEKIMPKSLTYKSKPSNINASGDVKATEISGPEAEQVQKTIIITDPNNNTIIRAAEPEENIEVPTTSGTPSPEQTAAQPEKPEEEYKGGVSVERHDEEIQEVITPVSKLEKIEPQKTEEELQEDAKKAAELEKKAAEEKAEAEKQKAEADKKAEEEKLAAEKLATEKAAEAKKEEDKKAAEAKTAETDATKEAPASADDYTLGSGDKLKITVFQEPDLSGEFEVNGQGVISFPMVGEVSASGLTLRKFEKALATKLSDGYLKDPKISVEVQNFRHFFIMGEVKTPGSYPYKDGLTVINAVALAGGYTHRASEGEVEIRRGGKKTDLKEDGKVMPGDTIVVQERLF